jgi:hypothetical protein
MKQVTAMKEVTATDQCPGWIACGTAGHNMQGSTFKTLDWKVVKF